LDLNLPFIIQPIDELMGNFQSKILQTEWEKHQQSILTAAQKRKAVEEQWQSEFEQKLQRWRQRNEVIQSQLDQKLDDLRAKYSDYAAEIKWDVQKIEDKEKDKVGNNQNELIAYYFQAHIV
jgi:DNA mismatch repair ATPase MutS